ncbi:FAD-binding protein [Acrocarpospora catenulata]|uniref:FAD-binding protein n=1 Tax=Acrocarpospora catenulata TaxID=2836182 RepID=UPI0027E17F20|nr:FAD-binding protein [Acrocarpospora catenulata]
MVRPQDVEDVVTVVKFCRRHGIPVAPRGQGHSLAGQSQVAGGIVLETSGLAAVHALEEDRVTVDAGILWSAVVDHTLPHRLTPPVLTDFLDLSVGGTLSMGGIGGSTFRYGLQIDNTYELQVVTGEGELLTCSRWRDSDLFEAVLGGLGQCGIIVRATVRLIPAPSHVRVYNLPYATVADQLSDHLTVVDDGRTDYVIGLALPGAGSEWNHLLQLVSYVSAERPADDRVLSGLKFQSGLESSVDSTYRDWLMRMGPQLDELKTDGRYRLCHVWSDVFVPASEIQAFAADALAEVSPSEVDHYFPVVQYAVDRRKLDLPLFRVPDQENKCFLFGILKWAEEGHWETAVAHNRSLYARARELNGTHYPHAALPLSSEEWRDRYGAAWKGFAEAKTRFDPDHILTPGPGIF